MAATGQRANLRNVVYQTLRVEGVAVFDDAKRLSSFVRDSADAEDPSVN